MKIRIWIKAFRLRTLPLAFSSIIVGSFLAASVGHFNMRVCFWALLTALFLQILSNLANDYGDSLHGADNEKRVGPDRITQKGLVSRNHIRIMIGTFVLLAFFSGTRLLFISLEWGATLFVFFFIGILAIAAAVNYTMGKNPYGYMGLGDLFVFLFFGLLGVAGTYFLHTRNMNFWIFLPASSVGLFSVGVLNLNNMRDVENDALSGKRTLVVRIGRAAAKKYHVVLLSLSLLGSIIYALKQFKSIYQFLFIFTIPLFVFNILVVVKNTKPEELNTELPKLALSTFLYSVAFGFGLLLE